MKCPRPDPSERRPSFFQKGGAWVLGQFAVKAAWLLVAPLGHAVSSSPWLWVPAALLLCIGAIAGIAGTLVLGRNRTPFPRPRGDSQLVQTGIFALVRHPLYASLIALSFGWACLWASAPGVVLAVLQAILLDAKARREERWLREQFPEYADYAAKVRRLIPWIY
jgi:protein-S-isoprenylcysteine O-methyltransferase Ste14